MDTEVLKNWRTLRTALASTTEEEASQLLQLEKLGQNRPTFLHRIYGRFSVLRSERERRELGVAS